MSWSLSRGNTHRVEGASAEYAVLARRARAVPEIYLGGSSAEAIRLAVKHSDRLLTFPDAPAAIAERVRPMLDGGKEVGLSSSRWWARNRERRPSPRLGSYFGAQVSGAGRGRRNK